MRRAILEVVASEGKSLNQSQIRNEVVAVYGLPSNVVKPALDSLVQTKDIVESKGLRTERLYSLWNEEA